MVTHGSQPPPPGAACCIIAGGDIAVGPRVRSILDASSLIIAADRGISTCLALGVTPTLCIGDFDSAPDEDVAAARARGWDVRAYPAEKAATDGELALVEAAARGARKITVLGALTGPDRLDHGVANLLMAARPALSGIEVRLVDEAREALVIHAGNSAAVTGERGDYVTLLPLTEPDAVITTWGLKYDLLGIALEYGSTRGVSNELAWPRADISVARGRLLVLHERRGGVQPGRSS